MGAMEEDRHWVFEEERGWSCGMKGGNECNRGGVGDWDGKEKGRQVQWF